MPYVATDAPSALDSTHACLPAAGDPPPVIHDRQTDPPTLPWIKLFGVDGWLDFPESVDRRESKTGADGEVPFPPEILGKTLVYRCEVRGTEREEVAEIMGAMAAGLGRTRNAEGAWTLTPYTAPGGVEWTFSARCTLWTPDPWMSYFPKRRAPLRWAFTFTLRLSDPYFYSGADRYPAE